MFLTNLLALLTLKAEILKLYLEGLTPEQRATHATRVFEILDNMNKGLDRVAGLFEKFGKKEGENAVQ